jgi:hypothetical protein
MNPMHLFVAGSDFLVLESIDEGVTWTPFSTSFSSGSREPFVRTSGRIPVSNSDLTSSYFELYVGTGTQLFRFRLVDTSPLVPLSGSAPAEELSLAHADPSDVIFDVDGITPFLVSGDGGLMKTADAGAHWSFCCVDPPRGLHALQIQDLTGQYVTKYLSSGLHLYFSSQDNSLHGSADGGFTWTGEVCCEGGALQVAPQIADPADTHVTYLACGHCKNGESGDGLQNAGDWPNAPAVDGSPSSPAQGPLVRLDDGWYLQDTFEASTPQLDQFRWSKDYGKSWEPGVALEVNGPLVANPLVVRENGGFTVLQAVQRPSIAWVPMAVHAGLVRMTFPQVSVTRIDDTLEQLGIAYFGEGHSMPLLAADLADSRNLLAVDIGAEKVKFSVDGGTWWYPDDALTALVTRNGQFDFVVRYITSDLSLISALSFDPYNSCHLLVGTRQGGIYRSEDGGETWSLVHDSGQIPNVSRFYFPPTGPVWVSSFGRGLWKLDVDRNRRGCPAHRSVQRVPPAVIAQTIIIDASTGAPLTSAGPDAPFPQGCENCRIILAYEGAFGGAEVGQDGLVRRIALLRGNAFEFTRQGEEVPLSIPNVRPTELDAGQVPGIFRQLADRHQEVRALIVRESKLVAVAVGTSSLKTLKPTRVPSVRLAPGASQRETGARVALYCWGWRPFTSVQVEVRADGPTSQRAEHVTDAKGTLRMELVFNGPPGLRSVVVVQKDGKRTLAVATEYFVQFEDQK